MSKTTIGQYSPPKYGLAVKLRHFRLRFFLWVLKGAGFELDGLGRVYSAPRFLLKDSVRSIPREGAPDRDAFGVFYDRIGEFDIVTGSAVDDLYDVMNWLREEQQFDKADRIRTIVGRLARVRGTNRADGKHLIREIARGYK